MFFNVLHCTAQYENKIVAGTLPPGTSHTAAAEHVLMKVLEGVDRPRVVYVVTNLHVKPGRGANPKWASFLRQWQDTTFKVVLASVKSIECTGSLDTPPSDESRSEYRKMMVELGKRHCEVELSKMVKALRGKYPTREEVGVATGHMPTPAHLHRFKIGNGRCRCGKYNADWRHLAVCPLFDKMNLDQNDENVAKNVNFAAISFELWRRGRQVCGSRFSHPIRDPNTIPLTAPPTENEHEIETEE